MKKKHVVYLMLLAGGSLLIFTTIPFFHIYKTYLKEDKITIETPEGYTNDASQLNLTKMDTIIDVASSKAAIENQLRDLIAYSKTKNIPISIAGAKHSMGGHTMYPDGILINMRPYSHMQIDLDNNTITVGAGALWADVIDYLNGYNKSVAVMQAFSSFSIGGSISVNGHGWQKNTPPISSSVVSFTLMDANGEIIACSPTQNHELFGLAIGGYGLFGIILDVTLKIVDNTNLKFIRHEIKSSEYLDAFKKYASDDNSVELVFGRLNITNKRFLESATLNVFKKTDEQSDINDKNIYSRTPTEAKRLVFRSTVNSEYGKRLRWDLETTLGVFASNQTVTRNQLLNDDVSLIENKDSKSTDILQEYFVPERHFNTYIDELKAVLPHQSIDLLNITIRDVYQDEISYLNYARENVFGFVFLFNQKKTTQDEEAMKALTDVLVQLALKYEGTFYLPYRLHVDKSIMKAIYPQADGFFNLKLKYDPQEVFKNNFYTYYR